MGLYQIYENIFLYTVIFFTVIVASTLSKKGYRGIKAGENNAIIALFIGIVFAIWLGMRPPTYAFADTGNYAKNFYLYKMGSVPTDPSDWLWFQFSYVCAQSVSVSVYFTIVSVGYFGFTLFACRVIAPNNTLVAYLFMLGSFSFFTYGVNGIRNGVACSILLFAIAIMARSRKNLLFAIIFCFLAANIHRSTMLPIASLFAAIYVVKRFQWAYTFWLISILISLVAGGAISAFFAGLGFDDRLSYIQDTTYNDSFSHTGFRWDFLIYSMMPIVLGYYVVIKRHIEDKAYLILLNTYTIANAFWVMLIRASYSNRFAYLSWFMYPIVLAYPLLKLDIWGANQGKRLTQIMLAHIGFTWFMSTFYW